MPLAKSSEFRTAKHVYTTDRRFESLTMNADRHGRTDSPILLRDWSRYLSHTLPSDFILSFQEVEFSQFRFTQ